MMSPKTTSKTINTGDILFSPFRQIVKHLTQKDILILLISIIA